MVTVMATRCGLLKVFLLRKQLMEENLIKDPRFGMEEGPALQAGVLRQGFAHLRRSFGMECWEAIRCGNAQKYMTEDRNFRRRNR